jgi:hypothetical protein
MLGRRAYLHALCIAVLGGCLNGRSGTETTASGVRAPWAQPDSPADIVVSNARSEAVTAALTVAGDEQTLSLGPNDDWVSEDVLTEGEDATVTLTTPDGLTATVEWAPEDESTNRCCVFNVDPERIRTDLFVK